MTGLLMKDLMMLKCQKQFFFVMGVVGLMFLVIYDNPTLVFGYLTIMFSFIPLTTLAYDDADNGSAYLFTLPVSRKGYLVEKIFVFCRLYPGSSASDSGSGHRGLSGKKLCRTARRAGRDGYDLYYCFRNLFSSINAGAAEIWFRAKPGGGGTDIGGLFGICYGGAWLMSRAGISLGELEDALPCWNGRQQSDLASYCG